MRVESYPELTMLPRGPQEHIVKMAMRPALGVFLAVLLPLVTGAQTGRQPEPANSPQGQEIEGEEPAQGVAAGEETRLKVDPGLMNKKVVVHLRDGRTVKGKLLEVADDWVRVKVDGRTEQIALKDVASVERAKSSRKWLLIPIVVGALLVVGVIVGVAVTGEGD